MAQKKGGAFLVDVSEFQKFAKVMEKAIADAASKVSKTANDLAAKMKQGGEAKEGSRLKEGRDGMAKLKVIVDKANSDMAALKQKVQAAKLEYQAKERSEPRAHIEARNQKEAAKYVDGVTGKVEDCVKEAKECEDAAAVLTSLSAEDVESYETPATTLANVEKLAASVKEHVSQAQEVIKDQQKAVQEVTPQTGGIKEAKQQLHVLLNKTTEAAKKSGMALSLCKNKLKNLVDGQMSAVAEGIRKHCTAEKTSPGGLFDSLKQGRKMSESTFADLVGKLDDVKMPNEHARLLCRKLEAGGELSRDDFLNFVVVYYKCVKTTVFTSTVDIKDCKPFRRIEEGEALEVLEGPVEDEESQMTRIRARAMKPEADSPPVEGWVTIAGNKGTTFLELTTKPKREVEYYKVVKTIGFTDGFDGTASKTLRRAEEGEVVQLLEGPELDNNTKTSRIRAKSTKEVDGVFTQGWITLSGSKGSAFLHRTEKPQ
jgi:hypothetical protein